MAKMQDSDPTPVSPVIKPGWQSSEFYLHLAAIIVGSVLASGAVANTPTALRIVSIIAAVLSALGYSYGRVQLKTPF